MGRNYYRGSLTAGNLTWMERIWGHFWVGSLMVMIMVGVSIVLLIGYLVALSTPFFKLEDVSFQGTKWVSQPELLEKGGLVNRENLLALNLNEVKRKMESIPWVKNVSLHRQFPNKLQVVVSEHQPLFLVLIEKELCYLSSEGIVFKKAGTQEGGSFPLLTGLEKKDWTPAGQLRSPIHQELIKLQTILSQGRDPFYPAKLSEVHYDPDCGFSLFTFERGIRITLGKGEIEPRIKRLEKVWAELEKRPNVVTLKGISLQFGQRVIVHGVKSKTMKGA